ELARAALVSTRYRDLAALSDAELRAKLAAAGLAPAAQEEALSALRAGPFGEPSQAIEAQGLAQARHDVQRAAALARAGDREAALLVAAMLALLRKAGRARDANAVHVGWLSALGAGGVTWWASGVLLSRLSGAHRELIEGVLQLVLAALILYASHWLFAAMSSRRLFSTFFQRSTAGASAAVVLG